jgi:glucosamine kinase
VPYYLGIDGGGTKTTCAVGDASKLLATATAGPSNPVRVGEAQTRESLHASVRQACAAAGITPEQVACTCIGGAGMARPELAQLVREILGEILPGSIDVVGDMQIALEAAFETGAGVIVNAGTGSFAYGRDRQGRTLRAGGWGFAIGDEGSAHWIARSAIAALLRQSDEDEKAGESALAHGLFKIWKVNSLLDLARAANSIPPPDFAALFPAVVSSQDDIAREILTAGGRELAKLAAILVHRLFPEEETDPVPIGVTGGVFRHSELVRETFYNELHRFDPRTQVNLQVLNPVEGALRRARAAASNRN